ncbi:MAG: hypothetical protein IJ594_07840 [Oscillospiraceae bacterium]|nr:hypothetical protein [Oscillospiraceae bacterium]
MTTEEKTMAENVEKFFELYQADEQLRLRVQAAEAAYPGSLEIRDAVAEAVLLPIAEDLGLPFTLKDLRAYETHRKIQYGKQDTPIEEGEPIDDDPLPYWLLEHGWEISEEKTQSAPFYKKK